MTDPAPKSTLKIGTPLIGGNRQDLRLQIATDCTVRVCIPLGDAGVALMTVDEFNKAEIALRLLSEPDTDGNRVEVGGTLPPELEGAPQPRVVSQGVGYIQIPITPIDAESTSPFVFNLWLRNFVVQKDNGSVAIELEVETPPWTLSDRQTAEKVVPQPRITSFTANRYNVLSGGGVTLKWTIEPAGNFELKWAGKPALVEKPGEFECNVEGAQDFVLEAWAGEKPANPDTRRLRVNTRSLTEFGGYELSAPDWPARAGVLGLYSDGSRLYALLRFGNSPYASLRYTEHGFVAAPREWREAVRKKDSHKPLIPVSAARRPGAIFNGKLFLIGGDCCSPNLSGRGMGYCDLNEDTGLDWQEVGENEAWSWPKDMKERMGHAVVALPNDKGLWIMGGWRQDGGVCDDVWQFEGTANSPWKKVEGLGLPRCLFGATATPAAVWTVGGFGSPGGTPSDFAVRRCAIGATSWDNPETLPRIKDIGADHQYCASVLFSREQDTADMPYGIATFWKGDAAEQKYFRFEKPPEEEWRNPEYYTGQRPASLLRQRGWYHMQSAVFREAIFFRTLIPDEIQALIPDENPESRAHKSIIYLVP